MPSPPRRLPPQSLSPYTTEPPQGAKSLDANDDISDAEAEHEVIDDAGLFPHAQRSEDVTEIWPKIQPHQQLQASGSSLPSLPLPQLSQPLVSSDPVSSQPRQPLVPLASLIATPDTSKPVDAFAERKLRPAVDLGERVRRSGQASYSCPTSTVASPLLRSARPAEYRKGRSLSSDDAERIAQYIGLSQALPPFLPDLGKETREPAGYQEGEHASASSQHVATATKPDHDADSDVASRASPSTKTDARRSQPMEAVALVQKDLWRFEGRDVSRNDDTQAETFIGGGGGVVLELQPSGSLQQPEATKQEPKPEPDSQPPLFKKRQRTRRRPVVAVAKGKGKAMGTPERSRAPRGSPSEQPAPPPAPSDGQSASDPQSQAAQRGASSVVLPYPGISEPSSSKLGVGNFVPPEAPATMAVPTSSRPEPDLLSPGDAQQPRGLPSLYPPYRQHHEGEPEPGLPPEQQSGQPSATAGTALGARTWATQPAAGTSSASGNLAFSNRAGWREPCMDLVDPRILTGSWHHNTIWTFWDCLAPFGARGNDLLICSSDGMAFPCASYNPCFNSEVLRRVVSHPPADLKRVLTNNRAENELIFGYQPEPVVIVDEDWRATNLLLLLVHPIPQIYLPDRATAELAMRLGFDYQITKAVEVATKRLQELDDLERAGTLHRPPQPPPPSPPPPSHV